MYKKILIFAFMTTGVVAFAQANSSVVNAMTNSNLVKTQIAQNPNARQEIFQNVVNQLMASQSAGGDTSVVSATPKKSSAANRNVENNVVTPVNSQTYLDPFNDLKLKLQIDTTMGFDVSNQQFGFNYSLMPSLQYYFGPRKDIQTRVSDNQAVYGSIEIQNFRISNLYDMYTTTANGGTKSIAQTALFGGSNYLVPVITWGDIYAKVNFYGAYVEFSKEPTNEIGGTMPYSARADVYFRQARYGQTLNPVNVVNSAGLQSAVLPALVGSKPKDKVPFSNLLVQYIQKDYGNPLYKTYNLASVYGTLTSDSTVLFLRDGVDNAFQNTLTAGPGITVGYTYNNIFTTSLMVSSYALSTFGTTLANDGYKSIVGLVYKIGLLPTNTFVPGLSVSLGANGAFGGKNHLGGINNKDKKPVGVSMDLSYQYWLFPNVIYIEPMVGGIYAFKTSNNPDEANAYTAYAGVRLGWPVGRYDDGTNYFNLEDHDRNDSVLNGNPIFGNNKFYGGLTLAMNYVREPYKAIPGYFNLRASLYENTQQGFLPGLGMILAYEVGHLGLNSKIMKPRQTLELYLGYYVTPQIRVYGGTDVVFAGQEAYNTFLNDDDMPPSVYTDASFSGTNGTGVFTLYDDKAQAYVKAGVLFEHIFPYTSIFIQYASDDLVTGYYNPTSKNYEKSGALTVTVQANM